MLFCYSCKNSNADELSKILDQLYYSIQKYKIQDSKKPISLNKNQLHTKKVNFTKNPENKNYSNFVDDIKTNSIIMIVKKEEIEKIKALLKKFTINFYFVKYFTKIY